MRSFLNGVEKVYEGQHEKNARQITRCDLLSYRVEQ